MKQADAGIMEHLLGLPEKEVTRVEVTYVDEYGRLLNEIANDTRFAHPIVSHYPLESAEESTQTAVVDGCGNDAQFRLEFVRKLFARTILIVKPGGIADYRLRYKDEQWIITRLEVQEKWHIKLADVNARIRETDSDAAKLLERRNMLENLRFNLVPKPAAKYSRNEDI